MEQDYIVIHETKGKCRSTGSSKTTSSSPVGERLGHSRSSPAGRIIAILCNALEGGNKERRKRSVDGEASPGLTSPLISRTERELLELLLEGPLAHGYASQLWTLPRIAEVIEGRFGVSYHPAHVWKILHACGWSCQKPQRWGKERDEKQIQSWSKEKWPDIKKR